MKDGMICNCKQVSYADVENALHQMEKFDDVLSAFDEVQKITHCSTGCGDVMTRSWMQSQKS